MTSRAPYIVGLGALLAVIAAVVVLALPAAAAPGSQGTLPTPTPFPLETVRYDLDTVGGVDETLTFAYDDIDGFTLGETTVRSTYPRGMIFTLAPESPNGAIQDVILFIRFQHGSGGRAVAEWDEASEQWVAHPWPTGNGQPAWTHFDFYWRVRDATGATVDTEPITMDYWDPNREWYRLETPSYIVYWWNLSDDDPDFAARYWAYTIEATEPRRMAGFGDKISYKPIATIYGTRQAWDETYGGGTSNPNAAGQTSNALGMSVQYVPGNGLEADVYRLGHVITHELTHMYQFDIVGGANGPLWWTEGQAEWFGISPPNYDNRLMNLAQLQDLPSFTTQIGASSIQADGNWRLAYDMGASFVNFVVANYGGIDTIRQIVEQQSQGTPFYDAIEDVIPVSFLDLENGWRTYIGLEPFELKDIDPAAALEPYDDPMFDAGDVVTLPSLPAISPIYEEPGERVLAKGQCFAGTEITIVRIGALDGVPYYEIDCLGQIGWMTREQLVGPE